MSKFKGFTQVELRKPQRSTFDLSHERRLSTTMAKLTPVLITEAIPGDSFKGGSEILLRLAPLLAPIYDQIQLFVHYFFVPNRLLWEDWEEFITGGRLGDAVTTEPIPPWWDAYDLINSGNMAEGSLMDYLGCPILPMPGNVDTDYQNIEIDAMPALAYQLVWFEYYRDRNYISDVNWAGPYPSGELDSSVDRNIKYRDYMKDYFTSALPFTQRGAEVTMPVLVSGDLPLYGNSPSVGATSNTLTGVSNPGAVAVGFTLPQDDSVSEGDIIARLDNISSSTTINDFRSAYALQVWLERNAVAGSRYTESIQAHFAVRPQDSRLQRPEYIGGGRIPVRISEVVSTAYALDQDDTTVPQGNMAGHGVTYGNTNNFSYFCPEHGFIIGIASIMAPGSYHQGMPRMFRRKSFLDYPWPTFAKLGEQQVDAAEIFASAENLTPDTDGILPLFGYQSRYADWKYIPNTNHGAFHSSLLYWTLTREFTETPELGDTFVEFDQTTQDRIFAAGGTPADFFWLYVHNRITVNRALPYFGTPNTIGFN